MQVEISEAARDRLERLVRDGIFTSIEDAAEAAIFGFDPDDIDWDLVAELDDQATEDIATGRVRELTPEFLAELRAIVTRR